VGFPVSLEDFVGSVRVGQTNRKFARWQGVKQHPFFAPFGWMDGWIDLKKHLNFFLGFAPRARQKYFKTRLLLAFEVQLLAE